MTSCKVTYWLQLLSPAVQRTDNPVHSCLVDAGCGKNNLPFETTLKIKRVR